MTTNNGVETINKNLKAFYLKISGTGTVSSLIETIVTEFIPEKIQDYERLNYMYSTNYKGYNRDVPVFLQNRPREVVLHCLKSISSATHFHAQAIEDRGDGTCLVRSEQSLDIYNVNLRGPSCECGAFQHSFLPCKHMFAVFNFTNYSWQSLPSTYRESPYLTLDLEVFEEGVDRRGVGAESIIAGGVETSILTDVNITFSQFKKNVHNYSHIGKKCRNSTSTSLQHVTL